MRRVSRSIVISCLITLLVAFSTSVYVARGLAQESGTQNPTFFLPEAQSHPLPPSLATWSDEQDSGNYFDAIAPAGFGYLVWTDFPVRVYLDTHAIAQSHESLADPVTDSEQQFVAYHHQETWIAAVEAAIEAWSQVIPLEVTLDKHQADIMIIPKRPPLRWAPVPDRTRMELSSPLTSRARTAETTYSVYIDHQAPRPAVLKQRYQIVLAPNQAQVYLEATARHELGHALGIWGHSSVADDALYFAQVAHPQGISPRDINTLQQIYQQPTQLGWPLIDSS